MSKRGNRTRQVKNMFFNTDNVGQTNVYTGDAKKNMKRLITPVQFNRIRQDVLSWRKAIEEAERAYYPFRVAMQRVYQDTVLNGHVAACMERRKDLNLLRDFRVVDQQGVENEQLTKQLNQISWLRGFMGYALDAHYYGYSLISLGDVVNGLIKKVEIVPRWFISPDRRVVSSFIYSASGASWDDKPYSDWHIFVDTPSEDGVSPCGYGLLYKVALYEIYCRNVLGDNADYAEMYGMPMRIGKTQKTDEESRADMEDALKNMGSAGYAIIDPMDEIEFLETAKAGTGYKSYESLEKRCENKISELILGHQDAMSSTPGKLGGGQGDANEVGDGTSPTAEALNDKKAKDGRWLENIINEELLPKLAKLGVVQIPEGYCFAFENDGEQEEGRMREVNYAKALADVAQVMKNAGMQMPPEYFTEQTGIDAEKIELPAPGMLPGKPGQPGAPKPGQDAKNSIKEKLERAYAEMI